MRTIGAIFGRILKWAAIAVIGMCVLIAVSGFLVLRAIENRTAIVRCGNTGISGFLDPLGRWEQKTPLFREAVVVGSIPLTNRLTVYTRFGDLIVYFSYGVLGLFLFMALRKKYFSEIAKRRAG